MTWKRGPLPPDTYHWGGVVPVSEKLCSGFYFADFCGDHVRVVDGSKYEDQCILKADEVAWYDNSLELPPCSPHRIMSEREGGDVTVDFSTGQVDTEEGVNRDTTP